MEVFNRNIMLNLGNESFMAKVAREFKDERDFLLEVSLSKDNVSKVLTFFLTLIPPF